MSTLFHIKRHTKAPQHTKPPQTRLKMFTCSFRVKRLRRGLPWHWELWIYRSSARSLQPELCFLCQGPTLILSHPFLHNDGLYHGGNGARHVWSSHKRLYFPVPGCSSGTASRPIFFCYFVHHKCRRISGAARQSGEVGGIDNYKVCRSQLWSWSIRSASLFPF